MEIDLNTINDLLFNVYYVDMLINLGYSREEAIYFRDNPILGPPIPRELEMRRRLGGHPVGRYRKC